MASNYIIQSVLIPRERFDINNAINWINKHHFILKKIDITPSFFRFRQINPTQNDGYINYRTKILPNGIELIIAYK